jgi:alpha-N-acetylglucosamine transferase
LSGSIYATAENGIYTNSRTSAVVNTIMTSLAQQQHGNRLRIQSALSRSRTHNKRRFIPVALAFFVLCCIFLNVYFVVMQQRQPQQQQQQQQPGINVPSSSAIKSASAVSLKPTEPIATIAHVVSLIKCTKQASVTGFLDAAAVLRHSIHQQSVHNGNNSTSNYSYQMYAIVHTSCRDHAQLLSRLGYKSLVRPSPVLWEDIEPGWYKDHVEGENCCGSAEFIKLYAYTLTDYPIVVHWDLDVALLQPMDDLFDAMLFSKDSAKGMLARAKLDVQHPHRTLPDRIDAYFTRDITSAQPWEIRQGVQGGFLVARPNLQHFDKYVEFIKRGNYTAGRGNDRGWDGLGYGGFQGAMAYQGAVAYFYDQIAPNTAVELNACTWNQVVGDVIWRGPNGEEHLGQCREYPTKPGVSMKENTPENGQCQDCRILSVDQVHSAHYTACKKPWECSLPYPRKPKNPKQQYRLNELTNITTCGLLFRKWFDLRKDFEAQLQHHAGVMPPPHNGNYEAQYFGGYCHSRGSYIAMIPPPVQNFDIATMYGV